VKEKNQLDRIQPYWNTYHCQTELITANGRVYGNYCKNKWCNLCCAIRKAKIINTYLPIIKEWEDLECNYNPIKKWYNPHLHLIVVNREMAEFFVDEWLERWTP